MSRFPIETVFEEFYKRVYGEMKCPSGNQCLRLAHRRQENNMAYYIHEGLKRMH